MLRYKTETRPALVALYDIRPGNGAGQFLQPRSPHRLGTAHTYTAGKGTPLYHHLDHRHNLDHSQYLITYPLIRKQSIILYQTKCNPHPTARLKWWPRLNCIQDPQFVLYHFLKFITTVFFRGTQATDQESFTEVYLKVFELSSYL